MRENRLAASGRNFLRLRRKKSRLLPCRPVCMQWLFFNEATTGRRLRPGALLIIYINIVRGAKRLWGESSMGRNAHGARHPRGETSMGRNVLPWGEVSMGRNVRGAKSPDTLQNGQGHRVTPDRVSDRV